MRLLDKFLIVLLTTVILCGMLRVFASSNVNPAFSPLGIGSLLSNYSQSSDQAITSSAVHFAETDETGVYAYPSFGLGATAPSLSLLSFPINPLLSMVGSRNSTSFGRATTDLTNMNIPNFLTSIIRPTLNSPGTTTGITPASYGFPLLASSKSRTVFDQESTNKVDKEALDLNTPRPSRIYVANNLGNSISVIDPATNTVIDTIPVGRGPFYIVLTPDHTRAYVNYCCGNNYIIEIDTTTNTVIANITLPAGSILNGLAIKPDGTRLYVTDWKTNTVIVIDTADNRITAYISVGIGPYQIAVNPAGTRAYVANGGKMPHGTNTSVIDTAANAVITDITVGDSPWGIAVSPDGTRAYVTNSVDNSVSVIDTASNAVIATIPVGEAPVYVAFTPDSSRAYVSNYGMVQNGTTVSVIDTAASAVIAEIAVGERPYGIAVSPDGTRAYVTNSGSNNVSVIDTASNAVIASIPVGKHPEGIAIT